MRMATPSTCTVQAAESHAAAELRAGHAEHVAQHPEKRLVAIDIDRSIDALILVVVAISNARFRGQVDDPATSRRIFPPRCAWATACLIEEMG